MREIEFSADRLVSALLNLSKREPVCLLDSGGASNLGSHLLIAGIRPLESLEITGEAEKTLGILDGKISGEDIACIFTISYDFGLKLQKIKPRPKEFATFSEPDVTLAAFDCLVIHDYHTKQTRLTGNAKRFDELEKLLSECDGVIENNPPEPSLVSANFTRRSYIEAIEKIQEYIRRGDTYQTNLTQQIHARLPENLSPRQVFNNLRNAHPAAFAAFIRRENDCVISASPERFFNVQSSKFKVQSSTISASPIKGTRPRGETAAEDRSLKNDLLNSEKDRAENVMIVDLLRNDLGRICKFGSIFVEKLCELETHPTLFHLVSTIKGELRENVKFSDILKAVFPCGSITGAPKISTMRIIDELETAPRGLSMGAIGYSIPDSTFQVSGFRFQVSDSKALASRLSPLDLNVAIRTMVIRNREAIFNVGGGITIDSVPEDEYEETLLKAKALLKAINGELK